MPKGRWWERLAYAAPPAAVLVHISFTLLAAGPISPFSVNLVPGSAAGLGRLFTDDWTFLAANPLTSDEELAVACLHDREEAASLPLSGWRSLRAPLAGWEAPANPLARRLAAMSIEDHFGSAPWTERWRAACTAGVPEACRRLETQVKGHAAAAGALLGAIGARACAVADPSARWAAMRYAVASPVPWSQRYQAGETNAPPIDLGVTPIGAP